MKTKQLAIDGMLAAMCAVLGYLAIDLTYLKITFETLPIILAALMFGPLDGLAVGGVGTLIYQLLKYGVSATTILWILPYCIIGILLGFYANKHAFHNTDRELFLSVVAAELLVTILNSGVMYVDAKLYGYWFPGFIAANLILRIVISIAKAAAFGAVLPKITVAVRRAMR